MAYKRTSALPIIEGGTNATTMATTDGVVYYDGTSLVTTAVGTAGDILTSNGSGLAPTFQAASGGGGNAPLGTQTQMQFGSTAGMRWISLYSQGPSPTQSVAQSVIPVNGTINNLYVNCTANTSTVDVTITVNKNSVNTAISVTVPAGTTGLFSDLVNTESFSAGDLIQFETSQSTTGVPSGSIMVNFAS